ncbi:MAG: Uma2 family endonuclease [Treponema sp.]|nr:Uma2 family endonuclease [Treponema sp.]
MKLQDAMMSDAALKQDEGEFTFADYLTWDDEERWELIDGKAYIMSSPSQYHQDISGGIFGVLWTYLRGKPCRVYAAPFDVRLFPRWDNRDKTLVQPDLLVICDKTKTDGQRYNGAPDMVIEILSPSTAERDLEEKFALYQQAGVQEYWIVDPWNKTIEVNLLIAGRYVQTKYDQTGQVPVSILPGCRIDFPGIWEYADAWA